MLGNTAFFGHNSQTHDLLNQSDPEPKVEGLMPKDYGAAGKPNGPALGFEGDLWRAADALRSNMDAAESKHVVLGLIFLKYISDPFEEKHAGLEADKKGG